MVGLGHALRRQAQPSAVALSFSLDADDAGGAGQGGWFQPQAFCLFHHRQQPEQFLIADGVVAIDQPLHGAPDESGWPAYRQAVCRGAVVDAEILHGNLIVQAGVDAKQHARRVGGFGKQAMHGIAKSQLQAEGHAAGAAAYAARQINEQRMRGVHDYAGRIQLRFQPLSGHSIAEEQAGGVFIIDKMAGRVALRLLAALRHRCAVVGRIFDHCHAVGAQHVFFPLAGVGRHMDHSVKTQFGADDADG